MIITGMLGGVKLPMKNQNYEKFYQTLISTAIL